MATQPGAPSRRSVRLMGLTTTTMTRASTIGPIEAEKARIPAITIMAAAAVTSTW